MSEGQREAGAPGPSKSLAQGVVLAPGWQGRSSLGLLGAVRTQGCFCVGAGGGALWSQPGCGGTGGLSHPRGRFYELEMANCR